MASSITSASNTYTDAIQGVTLTLKSLTNTPTTLNVARDTAAVNTAAAKFVENYNALVSQLKSRSAYGTATSTGGALSGDGTVRQMLDQLRGIFMTPASGGTLSHLAEIGITTQAGGTLKLSSSKLSSALTSDFADVTNLFNGATGFATRLMEWTTSVTQASGLIDQRTQSLNNSVKSYNDQIGKLELRMTALKKQYTTTYSNLNMMLSMHERHQQLPDIPVRLSQGNNMNTSVGINAYKDVGLETSVMNADPHQLVSLLFQGALLAISEAKYEMLNRRMEAKGKAISKAMAIIGEGLHPSLDMKAGGDIAQNLSALYSYMIKRLTEANLNNDPAALGRSYAAAGGTAGRMEQHPPAGSSSRGCLARRNGRRALPAAGKKS